MMLLTLSRGNVRDTTFTSESGLPLYVSSTPFRLGSRTTTIAKYVSDDPQLEMEERFQVVGEIEWHMLGPSIFRIGGRELKSDTFLPRHGFTGRKRTFKGPDDKGYRWDMAHHVVVLSSDELNRREVARYRRSAFGCFDILGMKSGKECLEVLSEMEHMLDLVILTFIYMETLRMGREWWRKGGKASTNPQHRL